MITVGTRVRHVNLTHWGVGRVVWVYQGEALVAFPDRPAEVLSVSLLEEVQ